MHHTHAPTTFMLTPCISQSLYSQASTPSKAVAILSPWVAVSFIILGDARLFTRSQYVDWSEAPGAFPGAYQTVRDGNEEGGYH